MEDVQLQTYLRSLDANFCAHCGQEFTGTDHGACKAALRLEPPRYCSKCKRRMVVQVWPKGWRATCSRHGEITGP